MGMEGQLMSAGATLKSLLAIQAEIDAVIRVTVDTLARGGTIFACGNGGSAAEAQHFVTELVGRFRLSRRPLRSIFLGGDASQMSCIANDFGWDEVFARPLAALARHGDLLVIMSTTGQSPSVLAALRAATEMSLETVALLGNAGGPAAELARHPLVVGSNDTARIQEAH